MVQMNGASTGRGDDFPLGQEAGRAMVIEG
jgi:hypothetical protein